MTAQQLDVALKISAVFLPMLYLLVAVGYGFYFFAEHAFAKRAAPVLLRVTLALHMTQLIMLGVRWQQFPAATVSQALSATAFAIAVVYALVEWQSNELATGLWMTTLACFFEVLSSLLYTAKPPYQEIFHNPLFSAHAGFGLLGYAAFAVAASYGFLFLRLYSEIKRRQFTVFFGKLPPLEVLERMMLGALLAGFIALTGALISGAVWANQVFAGNWLMDPKILVTIGTWGFYGLTIGLRKMRRWQGRQMAIASLAGFAAVLFSAVAVNFLFTDLHGFV